MVDLMYIGYFMCCECSASLVLDIQDYVGQTVHLSFDGKVAHIFSKETEKNLEY